MKGDQVLVIGGGVIGAMSAWYLTEKGYSVTVVDRDRFGAACSHGNCGYICPSHVLPLAQPGAIAKTLKAMTKPNSPFAIRPKASLDFISWFWKFYRQCEQEKMLRAGRFRHELLQSSMDLYRQLIEQEQIDCEWQEAGLLFVYDKEEEFESYSRMEELIKKEFGIGATSYDSRSLERFEPALKPGLGGAWHYEGDCHIRPDKFLSSIKARLEGRGTVFIDGCDIADFHTEAGGAKAVSSSLGSFEADHFVVATGAMTPLLNKHLGMRVPIQPGKGYSLTMPKPTLMPKVPIIFEDSHVAITPMETAYRIGSTMEFVGYDTSISRKRLKLLTDAAEKYLHEPYSDSIEEEWFGWRPMTWDGRPIIDRSPRMSNVWIAAGHSMLGLSMATGTGKLIAEMIGEEDTHIDASGFSASRF